jgi:hypothetical protein
MDRTKARQALEKLLPYIPTIAERLVFFYEETDWDWMDEGLPPSSKQIERKIQELIDNIIQGLGKGEYDEQKETIIESGGLMVRVEHYTDEAEASVYWAPSFMVSSSGRVFSTPPWNIEKLGDCSGTELDVRDDNTGCCKTCEGTGRVPFGGWENGELSDNVCSGRMKPKGK